MLMRRLDISQTLWHICHTCVVAEQVCMSAACLFSILYGRGQSTWQVLQNLELLRGIAKEDPMMTLPSNDVLQKRTYFTQIRKSLNRFQHLWFWILVATLACTGLIKVLHFEATKSSVHGLLRTSHHRCSAGGLAGWSNFEATDIKQSSRVASMFEFHRNH